MERVLYILFLCLICVDGVLGQGKPNILLILVDDMGYGDLSMAANPFFKTPNIDKLSAKGVQFSHFYVSPVCAPTRASLLTGKYHQRVGVQSVTNGFETMDPEAITLAEILKKENYRTALFGKWHLGEYYPSIPQAQGFDYFCGFKTGHTAEYFDPVLEVNGQPKKFKGYISDVLTDEAIQFIDANREQPFFCYLAYNAPHTPLHISSQYFQQFMDAGMDERTARVYGMILNLDDNIGRLIRNLEDGGLQKETLVIFLSDNGPISGWQVPQEKMRYNAGLRDQKFTVYEGGIRSQCFWYWPDKLPEKEVHMVAAHVDVVPTVLDLLGLTGGLDLDMDGISLVPAINDQTEERYVFQKFSLTGLGTTEPYPGGMVCNGKWKLVNGQELYNLDTDSGEKNNLAAQSPDMREDLEAAYQLWWRGITEECDLKKKPIEVGYDASREIYLQPHHATADGNLKFEGKRGLIGEKLGFHPNGVDGDWIVGFSGPGDRLTWDIVAVKAGRFQVGFKGLGWSAEKENIEILIDEKALGKPNMITSNADLFMMGEIRLSAGVHRISIDVMQDIHDNNLILNSLYLNKL